MNFLAFTLPTCAWLLGKRNLLVELNSLLTASEKDLTESLYAAFAQGPIRVEIASDQSLIAVWHTDYITGTGEESWGFIRRGKDFGLRSDLEISSVVLERCLQIINDRLNGWHLDGAWFLREHPDGIYTCLSGRGGGEARQKSIGFALRSPTQDSNLQNSAVLCVGPHRGFDQLVDKTRKEVEKLPDLKKTANNLVYPNENPRYLNSDELGALRDVIKQWTSKYGNSSNDHDNDLFPVEVPTKIADIDSAQKYVAQSLTYDDWKDRKSPLTTTQRRILNSDAIERHPLRILGPGGSGKTLLMQLLTMRRLEVAQEKNKSVRILYVVHNKAMQETVKHRFDVLGVQPFLSGQRTLDILTLTEYGRKQLELDIDLVVDADAEESKKFQLSEIDTALTACLASNTEKASRSTIFRHALDNPQTLTVLTHLVMFEISNSIKGHGWEQNQQSYVLSERAVSRFHGILSKEERELVFNTFKIYHKTMFDEYRVLDTDDIAITLFGRLSTPLWQLKRREQGYDYIFVDETQLFNENERRIFPMLSSGVTSEIPIVLALDEAQDIYTQTSAGIATLGISDVTNESLNAVHRSTYAIIKLAFFVIQRSINLFSADFPDFTQVNDDQLLKDRANTTPPRIEIQNKESSRLSKFVLRKIRDLRSNNLRQIGVICHADRYWDELVEELENVKNLAIQVVTERGVKLADSQPIVVLSKPDYVGGQEFDAVVLVGLEQGITPPKILDNPALASALEQQTIREIYLSITRCRYQIIIVLSTGATLTPVLADALNSGLIVGA